MIIVISQKVSLDKHGISHDSLDLRYIDLLSTLREGSAQPVIIPVSNNLRNVKQLLITVNPDLVVLSGGNNINYDNCQADFTMNDLAPKRDEVEEYLTTFSLLKNIPILAICRGAHFLNIYFNGSMTCNLQDHPPSVAHDCIYEQQTYKINSYHNHGILRHDLSECFIPLVITPKGKVIEAFTSSPLHNSKILAVQWHPERANGNKSLFKQLYVEYLQG